MKRKDCFVLVLIIFSSLKIFAQTNTVVNKTPKFSDFPLEEKIAKSYKILEIRYHVISQQYEPLDSIVIDGQKKRLFKSKAQAIEYYYIIKDIVSKREIFYVASFVKKAPEIYPFEQKQN